MTNILILSCGTRNKIVQYFKKSLQNKGNVIVTDASEFAPALYEADKYYIVPRITSPNYLAVITNICKKESITGVLSLIDPELSLLAKNKDIFDDLGITIVGSSYELCEMALDKWKMYNWLKKHDYKCAKSYVCKDEFYEDLNNNKIAFPVFVKPVRGSASTAITKVNDIETLEVLLSGNNDLMIQEYMAGQEIGADCYIDIISNEVVSIFTKKKLIMRAGETDKAVSFKDKRLFDLLEKFIVETGYRGQIDIDVFEVNDEYYISEVNPRFGGGYPHAYECGVNHMSLILNNLKGVSNNKTIGCYKEGMVMMKYNEIMIKNINEE